MQHCFRFEEMFNVYKQHLCPFLFENSKVQERLKLKHRFVTSHALIIKAVLLKQVLSKECKNYVYFFTTAFSLKNVSSKHSEKDLYYFINCPCILNMADEFC